MHEGVPHPQHLVLALLFQSYESHRQFFEHGRMGMWYDPQDLGLVHRSLGKRQASIFAFRRDDRPTEPDRKTEPI